MTHAIQNEPGLQFGRFTDVDATEHANEYAEFLEAADRWPQVAANRQRAYELLNVDADDNVLDVGCGSGHVVSELVTRGAVAVGIDSSQQIIAGARQRFPHCDFRVGSALALPFDNASFTRYRAERVLMHLPDPEKALAEARRVLVPGGRIVLLDVDLAMWVFDSDDMATTGKILAAFADTVASPWIGRRHRGLLINAGFEDVSVEVNVAVVTDYGVLGWQLPNIVSPAVSAGMLTQTEADAWLEEQARRGETNRFLRLVPMFFASARRP